LNRIKDQIKGYFTFNRTEQRGIVVLLVLIFIVILIYILLPYLSTEEIPDYSQFKKEIAEFEASQMKAKEDLAKRKSSFSKAGNQTEKLHPFPFDPNNLPVEKWKELGLSEKQIKVIKNYEKKGGRFYKKEDFAGIYSISEEEYKVLEPYIHINKTEKDKNKEIAESNVIKPFSFDPNTLEKGDWLKMGLNEKLVNTILNYRDKGGRFYKADDLKRIYGMKPEEFAILEPFIEIKTEAVNTGFIPMNDTLIIEINSADTLDLQQLKGIGPSFAKRIVKYRDMLGGYYSKSQLLEVYGMDSARYEGFKDFVIVNPDSVKKIDINSATIKQLIKHPYIDFYTAKTIVKNRQKAGKYNDVSELKDSSVLPEEPYRKVRPYLTAK